MKIEEIDNCDDLDDIKVFAILVTDVPTQGYSCSDPRQAPRK